MFAAVAVLFIGLSVDMLRPAYEIPTAPSNWFGVLFFSAALAGQAAAILVFAHSVGASAVWRSAIVAGTGGVLGAAANILEDGLLLEWAFGAFIVGSFISVIGLAALTVSVGVTMRESSRALAAIPAGVLVGWLTVPIGGGLLIATAWLAAAALALRRARANPT